MFRFIYQAASGFSPLKCLRSAFKEINFSSRPYSNNTRSKLTSVYIHWPYCKRKCTYCNFNKYVSNKVDHERMVSCLLKEWETVGAQNKLNAQSIFFGGGTPSLMRPGDVEKIISSISGDDSVEVTLEANPADIVDCAGDFKAAGVNRLSLGVQSFRDDQLRFFNRDHDAATGIKAIEAGLKTFGSRMSVDLIFGAPGQTVEKWLEELQTLINIGICHISTYQLTVERGTVLHRQVGRGEVELPGEEEMADMYIQGTNLMHSHKLDRYEISNFAVAGAECLHNISYWRGDQYVGLGPGSHGRVGFGSSREARINHPAPERWMTQVEDRGQGLVKQRRLDLKETLGELIATGLRRTEGVHEADWNKVSNNIFPFSDFISYLSEVEN